MHFIELELEGRKQMKQSIYKIFKDNLRGNKKKIILWGSGSGYTRWKDKIDFHADAIIDNNSKLWGSKIDGIPIIPPENLNQVNKKNTIVFILSFFYEEIKQQILSYGFEGNNIYSFTELERTVFIQEKKKRQEVFQRQNQLSIQEYIESIENDLEDIIYRDVRLLPVMVSYIALLTNYLFLKESNSNLFPVPRKKEYYVIGEGPILLSYVWHEKLRPDLNELIRKSVSDIPKEMLTELKPRTIYDEEENGYFISYPCDSVLLDIKDITLLIRNRISHSKYSLLIEEIDWFMDFVQYFFRLIDYAYMFFNNSNYQIYISGFGNNSEENIHIQVAKNLGILTFGLQHGTYGKKYEFNEVPFSHVYKYPTVDELFVWGVHSKEIVEEIKLDNSIVTVVGNPRYNLTLDERKLIKNSKKNFINKNTFLICFIGPGERELSINQEMLTFADKLAATFNMKYFVKMHPHNKVLEKEFHFNKENCIEFTSNDRNINSFFGDIDLIITTSSTVIHEAVYQYIPIFVYDTHQAVQSICGTLSTVFSKYEELEEMYKSCMSKEGFNNLMEEYDFQGNRFLKNYHQKRPTKVYKEKIMRNINNKKEKI